MQRYANGSLLRNHRALSGGGNSSKYQPVVILTKEGVAKSIKALNHEEHEGHEGKEKLFFVFFVFFVVPFFSEPFATASKESDALLSRAGTLSANHQDRRLHCPINHWLLNRCSLSGSFNQASRMIWAAIASTGFDPKCPLCPSRPAHSFASKDVSRSSAG